MVSRQTEEAKASTTTRVYEYGAVPIGEFPEEGIRSLFKLNTLWNTLVNLHNTNREDYEKARCEADDEYAMVAQSLNNINEKIKNAKEAKREARSQANARDPNHPLIAEANRYLDELIAERREINEKAKPLRKQAKLKMDDKKIRDKFNTGVREAQRKENTEGLDGPTANQQAAYFRTARDKAFKDNATLRWHRFDGTGFFFYRFRLKGESSDGVPFSDLYAKENDGRQVSIQGEDKTKRKPKLRMRFKVAGGAKKADKVYALFDVILHRPIPEGAQIQNAKLNRKRTGDKFSYTVTFTVRVHKTEPIAIQNKAIGVDIGFRQMSMNRIRFAAVSDSDGPENGYHKNLPEKFIKRMEHIDKLKGELDDTATALGKKLKPLAQGVVVKAAKEETTKAFQKRIDGIYRMKKNGTLSFEIIYKLARFIIREPEALPEHFKKPILQWWKDNSLQYREQHNLRRKIMNWRKDFYRNLAIDLVRKGLPIGVEIIDLSVFAEVKDVDNQLSNKARSNRFLVATSEFRDAIKNACSREGVAYVEVPAKNTSKTCSHCGKVNKKLKAEETWTCPSCGKVHDRDINAGVNIARDALKKLGLYEDKTTQVA